jgi:L-lactate dehydrogenase complex protein LldE
VTFPVEQTCCGQLHGNAGYAREAVALVRRFVDVFGASEAVVAPSSSCVAMVREQYGALAREAGDAGLERQVAALAPRVFELSEFLVGQLDIEDVGAIFPHRVTYHPACHSLRVLKVGDAPLRLLRKVAGIELRELPAAESCCGFGGTFAVKNSATSVAMLTDKLEAIGDSGAEVVCAADNSCLLHVGGGLSRQGSPIKVMHIAEILASR